MLNKGTFTHEIKELPFDFKNYLTLKFKTFALLIFKFLQMLTTWAWDSPGVVVAMTEAWDGGS